MLNQEELHRELLKQLGEHLR
jgi:hypothetical protein